MGIDSEILRTCKLVHNIGYAPNPGIRHRNQCMYKIDDDTQTSYHNEKNVTVPDSPMGRGREIAWVIISNKNSF